jgi:hypothetical protein
VDASVGDSDDAVAVDGASAGAGPDSFSRCTAVSDMVATESGSEIGVDFGADIGLGSDIGDTGDIR